MASAVDAPPAAEPGAAIVKAENKAPVKYSDRGVVLGNLAEMFRFAQLVHESSIAPKGMDSPQKIAVCLQYGAEFGLAPMASLRAVKVINGIPSFSGDAALALVQASGKLADVQKEEFGEGDDYGFRVTTLRVGSARPLATTFTIKDATRAGLWGKSGPWSQYPKRMLYYRALGFNLRDNFADVLAGAVIAEEAEDYPVAALGAGAVAQLPQRASAVDPLMETIGVTAPEATKPAVMPAPPSSPADEPGAAEAAALFTDAPIADSAKAPCCGGDHGPGDICPLEAAHQAPEAKPGRKAK